MTPARADQIDELNTSLTALEQWVNHSPAAISRSLNDPRFAGAATVLRAAPSIILTGSNLGYDAARYGAVALREAGFDSVAIHAADLSSDFWTLEPNDVVVGIDTNNEDVPAAVTRARTTGLFTIVLTDLELTLVDADVLVPLAHGFPASILCDSPLPFCTALSLLIARAEPAARLAADIAPLGSQLQHLLTSRQTARRVADHLMNGSGRLVIASRGPAAWAADGTARRLNAANCSRNVPPAIPVHLGDVGSPAWKFQPDDILVTVEPDSIAGPLNLNSQAIQPAQIWRIGGSPQGADCYTRLNGGSIALASLGAQLVLEVLLEEIAGR